MVQQVTMRMSVMLKHGNVSKPIENIVLKSRRKRKSDERIDIDVYLNELG